ncbi:hypothetical protein EV702DRAFT_59908 [Suillus placidus]|uniref:Uncharacterized protein n=1 Tax=Suillus placidus TaxID=48579 RepID=A0A9P7A0G0_9AGAM|nr:hypothetical protein EV702DRAFT_59908 [Suillus placidus]
MSHLFTRNLTFQSNDLGRNAVLMLTFDADMLGLYEDFFPVAWKVSKFGKTGLCKAHITYTSQLAFSKPQVVDGNIIGAESCVKIDVSEKTTLTEADHVYHFSPPQAGASGVLQAVNNTGDVQDIAVGFMNEGDCIPTPVLYFNDVKDGSHVTAQFAPVLRAYVTTACQETEIIRSEIASPVMWSHDLATLAKDTTWNLERNPVTGQFAIVKA